MGETLTHGLNHDQTVTAVLEALDNLEPASVHVAKANTRVEGFCTTAATPKYLMTVSLSIKSGDGDVITTVVNWGNHPEI